MISSFCFIFLETFIFSFQDFICFSGMDLIYFSGMNPVCFLEVILSTFCQEKDFVLKRYIFGITGPEQPSLKCRS
jgi:hypothetical protein